MVYQQMMRLKKSCCSFAAHHLSRTLLILTFISMVTSNVRADGGTVLWQRTTGRFIVTAFSNENPLRTGPADISLLVESADDLHPLVDAQVFIELENEAGATIRAEATHKHARNKLLYCGLINVPEAGHWKLKIIIEHGAERAELLDGLMVSGRQPMLIAYWKLLACPPVVIVLFVVNQWLCRNRTVR
jgi:hypothetical protein